MWARGMKKNFRVPLAPPHVWPVAIDPWQLSGPGGQGVGEGGGEYPEETPPPWYHEAASKHLERHPVPHSTVVKWVVSQGLVNTVNVNSLQAQDGGKHSRGLRPIHIKPQGFSLFQAAGAELNVETPRPVLGNSMLFLFRLLHWRLLVRGLCAAMLYATAEFHLAWWNGFYLRQRTVTNLPWKINSMPCRSDCRREV